MKNNNPHDHSKAVAATERLIAMGGSLNHCLGERCPGGKCCTPQEKIKKVGELTVSELEEILYKQSRITNDQQYKGLINSISRLLQQHEQIVLKRIDELEKFIDAKIPDLD